MVGSSWRRGCARGVRPPSSRIRLRTWRSETPRGPSRPSSRSGHPLLHLWCRRSGCQPGPPDCADVRSRMPLCHRRSGARSAQSQGRHNRRSAWPCLPSRARRSKVLAEPDPRGERDEQVEALLILDLAHDALQVSSATSLALDIRLPCLPRAHVEQGRPATRLPRRSRLDPAVGCSPLRSLD